MRDNVEAMTDVDRADTDRDDADRTAQAKADSAIELDEIDAGAEWDPNDEDDQPS